MKPISAEDKGAPLRRRTKNGSAFKPIGVIALIVAFLIGFAPSIGATSLLISDSNPESYIAVVILMLPLAILFTLKERLSRPNGHTGIIAGLAVFTLYAFLFSYLRVDLGYTFITYRVDALLSPLLIASLALVLFGVPNLKRFSFPIVFALFASPALLLPVVSLDSQFTQSNAQLVYGLLRFSGLPVSHSGLIIASTGALTSISISSTCTDLGLFIALAMLLVPLAYMFDGNISRKALWAASGIALMLAFNISRMYYISYQWITSGISAALTAFHIFAGQILFYATIIAMLALYTRYGLSIWHRPAKRKATGRLYVPILVAGARSMVLPIIVAILISLVSLALSLPSVSMVVAPQNQTGTQNLQVIISQQLDNAGMGVTYLGSVNISVSNRTNSVSLFALSNAAAHGNSSISVLAVPGSSPTMAFVPRALGNVTGSGLIILGNGVVMQSGTIESNGSAFRYSYFVAPTASQSYPYIAYMFYLPEAGALGNAAALCHAGTGAAEGFESLVYNLVAYGPYGLAPPSAVCTGYSVASSI